MSGGPISATAIILASTVIASPLAGVGIVSVLRDAVPAEISISRLSYDPVSDTSTYHPRARGYTAQSPLPAWWSASLTRDDDAAGTVTVCRGSGEGFYWDRPDALHWPLSVLVGASCPADLAPGSYRLTVTVGPLDASRPDVASTRFEVPG
jgi:hypothetical protein